MKTILVFSICVFLFMAGCTLKGTDFTATPGGNDSLNATPVGGQPDFGDQNYENGQNGQIPPFILPSLDLSKPAKGPLNEGEGRTFALGSIEFEYYTVAAAYPGYSNGVDILITAKNTGEDPESFSMTQFKELVTSVPNWNRHFFSFQADNLTLEPGEEKALHYFASADEPGQFDINIDFTQGIKRGTAHIGVYSYSMDDTRLDASSIIYGSVIDENGNPVQQAEVSVFAFGGRESYRAMPTDSLGRYFVLVPGVDDVWKLYGGQEILSNMGYFVIVDVDGYEHYYKEGISPNRGDKLETNITLKKQAAQGTYKIKWESSVSDYYGFFYALPDENWSVIAAAQAKHDPQLGKPTNFYLFDVTTGALKWKKATGDECWGFDIKNGLVAAGCSDGYVYVVDFNGKEKWKKDCDTMNREVRFSPDESLLLTGPCDGFDYELFDSKTGRLESTANDAREALRNSRFTSDGKYFVAGASFGNLAMYSLDGQQVWKNYIGEFPLFLEVDSQGNTYAGGKGRTIFSFDKEGNERWSFRVPDHVVTEGAISDDGARVVIGTVGAWVYMLDGKTGEVIWRDRIEGENVGHNAVSISGDGKYVAVGGAPQYRLYIYNEYGTRIFMNEAQENPDPILDDKWAGIGRDASAGSQKGIMGTYISENGDRVVAAYGDDYVRLFERID